MLHSHPRQRRIVMMIVRILHALQLRGTLRGVGAEDGPMMIGGRHKSHRTWTCIQLLFDKFRRVRTTSKCTTHGGHRGHTTSRHPDPGSQKLSMWSQRFHSRSRRVQTFSCHYGNRCDQPMRRRSQTPYSVCHSAPSLGEAPTASRTNGPRYAGVSTSRILTRSGSFADSVRLKSTVNNWVFPRKTKQVMRRVVM